MDPDWPEDRRRYVSPQECEALISAVERETSDPLAGIFGPGSISWTINCESALFLGAGRAALMQLAHPWVATALGQHSNLITNPIARFHNTFRIVFTMIFGSLAQATAAARHMVRLHALIQGEIAENAGAYRRGSHYEANEVAALRWVYATLVESAVLAYDFALAPLKPDDLNAYYSESKKLATLFGLSADEMPPKWDSFIEYCRTMEQSENLRVTASAQQMGQQLLAGAGSWIRPPQWYRALTTSWLPQRLRGEFGLKWGDAEERSLAFSRRWLPVIYRKLPRSVRLVGPWHEAQARLAGRPMGLLTRSSNRFWIGQPLLPFTSHYAFEG